MFHYRSDDQLCCIIIEFTQAGPHSVTAGLYAGPKLPVTHVLVDILMLTVKSIYKL